jgi:hypothetical protein
MKVRGDRSTQQPEASWLANSVENVAVGIVDDSCGSGVSEPQNVSVKDKPGYTCYSDVAQSRVCVVHVWCDQLKDAGGSHTLDLAI